MRAGDSGNLFRDLPTALAEERFDELLARPGIRIERIVSCGQATPAGTWYDQEQDEWVVLLRGRAGLRFEDEAADRTLGPADWLFIVAHRRHRVSWTAADETCVWLAVHFDAQQGSSQDLGERADE